MFSATVMCGNSAYDWNTIERLRCAEGRDVTSRPAMLTVPEVARFNPAISRSVVDFPHPEGPSKATNSQEPVSKLTLSTAQTLPSLYQIPYRYP